MRIKHERLSCSLWLRFRFWRYVRAARRAELRNEAKFSATMSLLLSGNRKDER